LLLIRRIVFLFVYGLKHGGLKKTVVGLEADESKNQAFSGYLAGYKNNGCLWANFPNLPISR